MPVWSRDDKRAVHRARPTVRIDVWQASTVWPHMPGRVPSRRVWDVSTSRHENVQVWHDTARAALLFQTSAVWTQVCQCQGLWTPRVQTQVL